MHTDGKLSDRKWERKPPQRGNATAIVVTSVQRRRASSVCAAPPVMMSSAEIRAGWDGGQIPLSRRESPHITQRLTLPVAAAPARGPGELMWRKRFIKITPR